MSTEAIPTDPASALDLLMPNDAPERLRHFSELWLAARRARLLPTFADIDPAAMVPALPYVFTVGRSAAGRCVYRLVGEEMDRSLGGNLRGKSAWDIFPADYAVLVEQRWQRVLNSLDAAYIHTRHTTLNDRSLQARRLMFPLAEPDGSVRRLIGVSHFEKQISDEQPANNAGDELHVRWTPAAALPGAFAA